MAETLKDINGIGPKRAESLNKVGIFSISDLYERTRTPKGKMKLEEDTGIGKSTIDHFAKVASLSSINFINVKFAEFLIEKEVESVEDIATLDENGIKVIVEEAAKELPGTCIPSEEDLGSIRDTFADKLGLPCSENWFEKLEMLRRNNFFEGKLMTARDACLEQEYGRKQDALERRTLVGTGIVWGLDVYFGEDNGQNVYETVIEEQDDAFPVIVSKGLAIDPFGRFIVVPADTEQNLYLPSLKGEIGLEPLPLYLYIYYSEQLDEWVPQFVRGEPCGDMLKENMIIEGFELLLSEDEEYITESAIAEPGDEFPDPGYKCVLLAELSITKTNTGIAINNVTGKPDSVTLPRVYSNPKLYDLIKDASGGGSGGVQVINEAKPDGAGLVLLSPGKNDGIAIEKSQKSNEILFTIKHEYVKEIVIDGPGGETTITGNKHQVRFKAGKGITIERETQNRLSIGLDQTVLSGGVKRINDALPDNKGKIGFVSSDIDIESDKNVVKLSLNTDIGPFPGFLKDIESIKVDLSKIADDSYLAEKIIKILDDDPDPPWRSSLEALDNKLNKIAEDTDFTGLIQRVNDLEKKIKDYESEYRGISGKLERVSKLDELLKGISEEDIKRLKELRPR